MKPIAVLTMILAAAVAPSALRAADQQASAPPASQTRTIPKEAVANADGTWSYTDKQGKHWTYTNTPFGVKRTPADSTPVHAKVPAGLPKDAVANADGTYSWTDRDGKKWNYVSTPFGFSRNAAAPSSYWKVTDQGDTVRFERPAGPMGTTVWEKKKTELTDEERQAWESQKANSPSARPE